LQDTGMFSFKILCQYYGMNIDEEQIRHEFSIFDRKLNTKDIQLIGKKLGFKTRIISETPSKLGDVPLPCIALDKEDGFFVIAKKAEDKVLILTEKDKKPLVEVLISALTFQLLGVFSPRMTQVVIDKVLVHRSTTTLDVLAVGLLLIIIFELVMGVAKTYVFTNTTSKSDVILASRLYRHLQELPLRYFETRRVGIRLLE